MRKNQHSWSKCPWISLINQYVETFLANQSSGSFSTRTSCRLSVANIVLLLFSAAFAQQQMVTFSCLLQFVCSDLSTAIKNKLCVKTCSKGDVPTLSDTHVQRSPWAFWACSDTAASSTPLIHLLTRTAESFSRDRKYDSFTAKTTTTLKSFPKKNGIMCKLEFLVFPWKLDFSLSGRQSNDWVNKEKNIDRKVISPQLTETCPTYDSDKYLWQKWTSSTEERNRRLVSPHGFSHDVNSYSRLCTHAGSSKN